MKTIKTEQIRKVIQTEGGLTLVEHTVVRKADEEVEEGQNRPYPTLPKSANPNDPPAHASEK